MQRGEREVDRLVGGVGGDRADARVAAEALVQAVEPLVAVEPGDAAIAFAHPEGGVALAAALLDHQQLRPHQLLPHRRRLHQSRRRILIPSETKPLPR